MEGVPTDDTDRPKTPITIKKITIFVNPFEEARKANQAKEAKQAAVPAQTNGCAFSANDGMIFFFCINIKTYT